MNKKYISIVLVIALAVVLFVVRRCQADDTTTPKPKQKTDTNTKRTDPAADVDRNRGFDRRVSYIEYTRHAECRMDCRKISQSEVEDIMRNGTINYKKSDVNARPCPTYALEGVTKDNQRVRIVYAQCDLKTKVVTVIDLGTDWQCDCPGDDKKHQNNR